jgi:hypothetical protein
VATRRLRAAELAVFHGGNIGKLIAKLNGFEPVRKSPARFKQLWMADARLRMAGLRNEAEILR